MNIGATLTDGNCRLVRPGITFIIETTILMNASTLLEQSSVLEAPIGHRLMVNGHVSYTLPYTAIGMQDVMLVGGKNASLGEMTQALVPLGIRIPEGFAITTAAFRDFLSTNRLEHVIEAHLAKLDRENFSNLHEIGENIRRDILNGIFPESVERVVRDAYRKLSSDGMPTTVAVRSSATTEDLSGASFAGQLESYLNISGGNEVIEAVHKCFASLYTDRAIKYREDRGFAQGPVEVSVGIQRMVRSDKGSSGVAFTIDPDSGFQNAIVITGAWGLGENVVQGAVEPDEFIVFKPALRAGNRSVISHRIGAKEKMLVYAEPGSKIRTENLETPASLRERFVLTDLQLEELGDWLLAIEDHYHAPMDVEWALDGVTNELWIVQARPETVRSKEHRMVTTEYELVEEGIVLARGIGLGNKIVTGPARILNSSREEAALQKGEILITDITSPDWDPVLKRALAIVTNKGGRTSHAAIVARELGTPAVVGAIDATEKISTGETITVVCDAAGRGTIYRGALRFSKTDRDLKNISMPRTKPMLILADPEQAFELSMYPNKGVGLLRLEFIITDSVRVHPMALVNYETLKDPSAKEEISRITKSYKDKKRYFVETLAEGVARIAAAFYPKDVIVRMSDFKTNEYANLVGGAEFEPKEENPMLGFRGASRYYHEHYRKGFELECQAMKLVREDMGLQNVKLMIPFCRTVEEGRRVLGVMEEQGLHRGENNLEVYVMAEIPSNVILAKEFAEIFDGFSIGSNDLTQLTLGIDRDSSIVGHLFDERNEATTAMIASVIKQAREAHRKIGLCGQAPSDHAEFAAFLVQQHIDSISFNPDALLRGIENINRAEAKYPTLYDLASRDALTAEHGHDFDMEE